MVELFCCMRVHVLLSVVVLVVMAVVVDIGEVRDVVMEQVCGVAVGQFWYKM